MHNWSFSLAGSPLQYTLSTEDIKIKHEVGKSLKQFSRSSEQSGTDSHLSCLRSQLPPVLAQVPVANWSVINHVHCELHDQLREPGPLSASAVHCVVHQRKVSDCKKHQVELCQTVARSVVENNACDSRRSRVSVDDARRAQLEQSR